MIGLTSVTFRDLSCERIIEIAKGSPMDGIEWGGDVHVPHGETQKAREVFRKTVEAGLNVLSYGSYYTLCKTDDPRKSFRPVLDCALALHAPVIRIWAGETGPDKADEAYYRKASEETKLICRMAEPYGITIGLEYHPDSLTATCESAVRFLKLAGCGNLKTYWQQNPGLPFAENSRELAGVLPYLCNIHTFFWKDNTHRKLSEGREDWLRYIEIVKKAGLDPDYILEFVADGNVETFKEDAAALRGFFSAP